MSTTPQGSTSNQDDITLTTTNTTTTITVTEQEYIVIGDDSDCRRNEAFDLPKSKKFRSSTTIISNGSDPTIMSSNGNGTNPVEVMEHTNGGTNCNGVCFYYFIYPLKKKKSNCTNPILISKYFCAKTSS
jgi:hypothetical protein